MRVFRKANGSVPRLSNGAAQMSGTGKTCCCEGSGCPDPGECVDCPCYLTMSGTVWRRTVDGELVNDDEGGEAAVYAAVPVRSLNMRQSFVRSFTGGHCCITKACEWAGTLEYFSPSNGWVAAGIAGVEKTTGSSDFVSGITLGGYGNTYSMTASCPAGTYASDDAGDSTTISFSARSYDSDIDEDCCTCETSCVGCRFCVDGPSSPELSVNGGSLIGSSKFASYPCKYVGDADSTYSWSLEYQASGVDENGDPIGEHYWLRVVQVGTLANVFDGYLLCSGSGTEMMLGSYTKRSGTATTAVVS